jgi:hypothetical protein
MALSECQTAHGCDVNAWTTARPIEFPCWTESFPNGKQKGRKGRKRRKGHNARVHYVLAVPYVLFLKGELLLGASVRFSNGRPGVQNWHGQTIGLPVPGIELPSPNIDTEGPLGRPYGN